MVVDGKKYGGGDGDGTSANFYGIYNVDVVLAYMRLGRRVL